MINHLDHLALLKQVYGSTKLYLYEHGMAYEGWFIVPVYWGDTTYAVACLAPEGTQHAEWHGYPSIDLALQAGQAMVEQQLAQLMA